MSLKPLSSKTGRTSPWLHRALLRRSAVGGHRSARAPRFRGKELAGTVVAAVVAIHRTSAGLSIALDDANLAFTHIIAPTVGVHYRMLTEASSAAPQEPW